MNHPTVVLGFTHNHLAQEEDLSPITTGKKDASKAGKILPDPSSSKAMKNVAASDLAQAAKKGGHKK